MSVLKSYPKTSWLEQKLFDYIKLNLPNLAIHTTHPDDSDDFVGERLVISQLSDPIKGNYQTRAIASPLMQFAAYSKSYPKSRQVYESIVDLLENWNFASFSDNNYRVLSVWLDSDFGVSFEELTHLHIGTVSYRFTIAVVDYSPVQ